MRGEERERNELYTFFLDFERFSLENCLPMIILTLSSVPGCKVSFEKIIHKKCIYNPVFLENPNTTWIIPLIQCSSDK